jgi:serine/threonine protein kinase
MMNDECLIEGKGLKLQALHSTFNIQHSTFHLRQSRKWTVGGVFVRVTGLSGVQYDLDTNILASGGEGDIRIVSGGARNKVAKIYKHGAITPELEEKLKFMKYNPPDESVLAQVAWPLDLIYDNNRFCGFIMPRLNINAELGEIYPYPSRPPMDKMSMQHKIVIAQNICAVISAVHSAGYVFGDFNPRNIGVDTKTCLVAFLDTDSYHVKDGFYRCKVALPGYVAPELLAKCAAHIKANPNSKSSAYADAPLPTFTQETDNFALAIHIFRLLMNGYSPFGGIADNQKASQGSPGLGDDAIRRDSYCFKPGNKPQSAAVLPLNSLPAEIGNLFTRAFINGRNDPAQRPTAFEWHGALDNFREALASCRENPAHQFYNKNSTCPLCEADQRFAAIAATATTRPAQTPIAQRTFAGPVTVPTPARTPAPSAPARRRRRRYRGIWRSIPKRIRGLIVLAATVFIVIGGFALADTIPYLVFEWFGDGGANDATLPAIVAENPGVSVNSLHFPNISEYGRLAAEAFIMQLPTIFTSTVRGAEIQEGEQRFRGIPIIDGEELNDGRFSRWEEINGYWQEIITDTPRFRIGWVGGERIESGWGVPWLPILTYEMPDIYLRMFRDSPENSGFYDRFGNKITNAPWILGHSYAITFFLMDLDGNGIPEILVGYESGSSLFKYVNGEYRRVTYSAFQIWQEPQYLGEISYYWPWGLEFYFDAAGNLIGYLYDGSGAIYVHITFSGSFADINVIARGWFDVNNVDWDNAHTFRYVWNNYITGQFNFIAPAHGSWNLAATSDRHIIPGTNILLTPAPQLFALEQDIFAAVAYRLGQQGFHDAGAQQPIPTTPAQTPPEIAVPPEPDEPDLYYPEEAEPDELQDYQEDYGQEPPAEPIGDQDEPAGDLDEPPTAPPAETPPQAPPEGDWGEWDAEAEGEVAPPPEGDW